MSKYNVSADLLVPVLLEIEGASYEDVLDKLRAMPTRDLLKLANTENGSICILDGSEDVSRVS